MIFQVLVGSSGCGGNSLTRLHVWNQPQHDFQLNYGPLTQAQAQILSKGSEATQKECRIYPVTLLAFFIASRGSVSLHMETLAPPF